MDIVKNRTTAQPQTAEHKQLHGAQDAPSETAQPYAFELQSISTLRSKARKKRISGRSTMNKTELIMALRKAH